MRKLTALFTDFLLGPAPTALGAAPTTLARADAPAGSAHGLEVIVVDDTNGRPHDFLGMFPAETADDAGSAD